MMKFLVIGGSSFIGVYVVDELLSRGAEVVATGRNERFATHYEKRGVPYLNLDICDKGSFDVFGDDAFDGVVSLAARMPANIEKDVNDEDIAEYITTNVVGTINILEWCRSRGIRRLVDIISRFDCRLYDHAVITEDTPLKFSYCDDHAAYVVSNNEKAEMLNYYNKRYAMRNIWLRIPSVYGVGPHGTFAKDGVVQKSGLQIFMEKATVGEKIVVFGNPSTPKDVLYVKTWRSPLPMPLSQVMASDFTMFLMTITFPYLTWRKLQQKHSPAQMVSRKSSPIQAFRITADFRECRMSGSRQTSALLRSTEILIE